MPYNPKQEPPIFHTGTETSTLIEHAQEHGIAIRSDGLIFFADGSSVQGGWSIPASGGMRVNIPVEDLAKIVKAMLARPVEPFILMAQDHRRKRYITSKSTREEVEAYIAKLDPGAACFGPMILSAVVVYQGKDIVAEFIDPDGTLNDEERKGSPVFGKFMQSMPWTI